MPSDFNPNSMDAEKKTKPLPLSTLFLFMIIACFAASVSGEFHALEETCSDHQPMNVGILNVWHDDTSLYVEYNITHAEALGIPYDFEITETRLAVGGISMADSDGSNQYQFPFSEKHEPSVQTYTYVIDFEEWDEAPEKFYIAAQAVLVPSQPTETEWGDDFEVCETGFDWATYFNYTLKPPEETNTIEAQVTEAVQEKRPETPDFYKLASY